jgi:carbon-monoxide dehydrogenase medium subunit
VRPRPIVLVDLSGIPGLRSISLGADGTLELGAMTTYSESSSRRRRARARSSARSAPRSRTSRSGTADDRRQRLLERPDEPPAAAAWPRSAPSFAIRGADGERTVASDEFFLGVYMTAVGPGELLTKIRIPAGRGDGFAAVTLGVDGTCIVSAAASLNGGVRIALGCVDAVPVVVTPASADEDAIRAAVREQSLDPPSDVHATGGYRRHLAEVLAARAVNQASERRS